MKKLFPLVFIFLFCHIANGQINIIFRCDDFRMIDDSLQEKIIDLFSRHEIPLCFCVIPADTLSNEVFTISDENLERWIQLKNKGLLDIGLHGFTHRSTRSKYSSDSELDGLSYNQQLEIFQKGKKMLESHLGKINYFVPPTNLVNRYTIDALETSGFEILSANVSYRNGFSSRTKVKIYPCTTEDFRKFADFYYGARYKEYLDGTIILLFHPYTFTKGRYRIDDLDTMLCSIKNNGDFRVCTFNSLKEDNISGYDGGLRNKNLRLMRVLFRDKLFYLNRPSALLANSVFYLLFAIIGLLITIPAFFVGNRRRSFYIILPYLLVIAIVLFFLPISYKVSFFIMLGIGILIDLWVIMGRGEQAGNK